MIIVSKFRALMKSHWLQSTLYRYLVTFRFYKLPALFGKKPTADVYVSLNDPNSFMLVKALINIEKKFDLQFRLYLVMGTPLNSNADEEIFSKVTLKNINDTDSVSNETNLSSFPNKKALITGQQTWLFHVQTLKQALDVFKNTWSDSFIEHYPFSTPMISAQIKNKLRMSAKGCNTSAAIYFCGQWYSCREQLQKLELLLQDKCLNKNPCLTSVTNSLPTSH